MRKNACPTWRRLAPMMSSLLALVLATSACGKKDAASSASSPAKAAKAPTASAATKGDALFLAETPVIVPDEVEADLDAMGIGRLFVPVARFGAGGKLTALVAPPTHIKRPVVAVLMGEGGVEGQLGDIKGASAVGDAWATSAAKAVKDAKAYADVVGLHFHIFPKPEQAETLAAVLKTVKKAVGVPISVTIPADGNQALWKPLASVVDEVTVFTFGRRPETGDKVLPELTEEGAKKLPLPFRLLIVPGSYGFAGGEAGPGPRRLMDSDIDKLSEEKNLDFDFGKVLSSEPGSLYRFKPKPWAEQGKQKTSLSADGGFAHFQFLAMGDLTRLLTNASRWASPNLRGRVFVVDGVPRDSHVLGFPMLKAFLTGKATDPVLKVTVDKAVGGKGFAEITLAVSNPSPTNTELSHFNNWVRLRVEGAVIASVKPGDFDRYELLLNETEGARQVPFGRGTVVKLYENFLAPEEVNMVGPIRLAGARPRAFISSKISLPDGRVIDTPESEIAITIVQPTPVPKAKGKR